MEPQLQPRAEAAPGTARAAPPLHEGLSPRRPKAAGPSPVLIAAAIGLAAGILLKGLSPSSPPAAQPPAPVAVEAPAPAPAPPVPHRAPRPVPSEDAELRPFDLRDARCSPIQAGKRLRGARLLGRGSNRHVYATILRSFAGSDHRVYAGSVFLGTTAGANGRNPIDLGPLPYGAELQLRIEGDGGAWRSGPGARNSDRQVHALVTPTGVDAWKVSFEDLESNGDGDFDDAIIALRGELAAAETDGTLRCSSK
ncbi:MAG: hypothetical protein HY553_05045 [Elusimicrobia bacterium]|nr:hypothetical protein [Elusimicrobiota bacterium]